MTNSTGINTACQNYRPASSFPGRAGDIQHLAANHKVLLQFALPQDIIKNVVPCCTHCITLSLLSLGCIIFKIMIKTDIAQKICTIIEKNGSEEISGGLYSNLLTTALNLKSEQIAPGLVLTSYEYLQGWRQFSAESLTCHLFSSSKYFCTVLSTPSTDVSPPSLSSAGSASCEGG